MEDVKNLELPLTKDLTRDLLADFIEKNNGFDIDKFLLQNNFQYVPLDELAQDVSVLKHDRDIMMLDEVTYSYPDYSNICKTFDCDGNSELLNELKNVLKEAEHFRKQVNQLVDVQTKQSSEKVAITVSYLKSLDNLIHWLDTLDELHEALTLCGQLLASFESMLSLKQDDDLTVQLATQLAEHLVLCDHSFRTLSDRDSPLVSRLRNQFKGILQAARPLVTPILQKNRGQLHI